MANNRTNEDKLQPCDVNFNAIHNVEDISGSGTITEPVTLQQAKDYLRLEGYQPDDDSPADEFDFDDGLITSLIVEGRRWCEEYTGIHLVPKTLRVDFTNGAGLLQFPGPVTTAVASIVIADKNSITQTGQVFWIGQLFPKLETSFCDRMQVEYEAGYGSDVPDWAKNAIKAYVADHYEYRGDDAPPAANVRAAQKCRPYRKIKSWA
jgi:hypothetical protein